MQTLLIFLVGEQFRAGRDRDLRDVLVSFLLNG
jgi:hypothetical protein